MDGNGFDHWTVAWAALSTRRHTLRTLSGLGLAGLLDLREGDAKKHKKHKKKHGKGSPPASPPASPPPGPIATADASCVCTGTEGFGYRVAQTFRALRSGQLTSATIYLGENTDGVDLDVEIRSVDETGARSALLAGTTIINVPATVFPGPRRLTATFPTPAAVVEELRYALVVSGPLAAFGWQASDTDPCPEGAVYYKNTSADAWISAATFDLHFETIVTA
jgi:hypothetical protein